MRKLRSGREMRFYTTREVQPGEELCTNYIDVAEDDVRRRRAELERDWYFWCACERCMRESGS